MHSNTKNKKTDRFCIDNNSMPNDQKSEFEKYTDSDFRAMLLNLIPALQNYGTRDHALHLLSKAYKETHNKVIREEMAPLLWHSVGTISLLLQEVILVYGSLFTDDLPERLAVRVCSALTLLQSVAAHPDTRMHSLRANIPLYLQPILNVKSKERHHDYVKISSLGVIGALVKDDDPEAIRFILQSEIFPCFLNCMKNGSVLAKTVAVFIVKKILSNGEGLSYCCAPAERFFTIALALGKIIEELAEIRRLVEDNFKRLLKHVIGCYYRLSANPRACNGLGHCLRGSKLRHASFTTVFHDDEETRQCLQQIFYNIEAAQQRLQGYGQSRRNFGA